MKFSQLQWVALAISLGACSSSAQRPPDGGAGIGGAPNGGAGNGGAGNGGAGSGGAGSGGAGSGGAGSGGAGSGGAGSGGAGSGGAGGSGGATAPSSASIGGRSVDSRSPRSRPIPAWPTILFAVRSDGFVERTGCDTATGSCTYRWRTRAGALVREGRSWVSALHRDAGVARRGVAARGGVDRRLDLRPPGRRAAARRRRGAARRHRLRADARVLPLATSDTPGPSTISRPRVAGSGCCRSTEACAARTSSRCGARARRTTPPRLPAKPDRARGACRTAAGLPSRTASPSASSHPTSRAASMSSRRTWSTTDTGRLAARVLALSRQRGAVRRRRGRPPRLDGAARRGVVRADLLGRWIVLTGASTGPPCCAPTARTTWPASTRTRTSSCATHALTRVSRSRAAATCWS